MDSFSSPELASWCVHEFLPVIRYPRDAIFRVLDLSAPGSAESEFGSLVHNVFTIGKYNEKRGIYDTEMYTKDVPEDERRCIHLGIDLGGPIGTPVFAPCKGEIFKRGYNPAKGDYGYCLITRHMLGQPQRQVFFLFGHLGEDCMKNVEGDAFEAGALLGHLGSPEENGGWPPHLHFQVSFRVPTTHDLPGVCSEKDREACLKEFPDPRLVLGPLYSDSSI